MTTPSEGRRLPALNMLALVVAAAASLATLADGTPSGRSSAWTEWSGEGGVVHITIDPGDRSDGFGYDGTVYLDIEMLDVPEGAVDVMRWALTADPEGGEPFSSEGGFIFGDYSGEVRGGQDYGEAEARLGPLCDFGASLPDDLPEGGCIPCSAQLGCTLTLVVDRCAPVDRRDTRIGVTLARADGHTFHVDCPEDSDQTPCDRLNDWIQLETTPLQERLCSAQGGLGGEDREPRAG